MKIYLIASAALLVAYLVAQYYKPIPTNWTTTYLKTDKIPFGTYILHQQLNSIFPSCEIKNSQTPIYNTFKNKQFSGYNYLIITSNLKLDKLDYQQLINFIKSGNQVFIAATQFNKVLNQALKLDVTSNFNLIGANKTSINFTNPTLKNPKNYKFDREIGDNFFSEIDTAKCTVLGITNNGKANFIQYKFGKGTLFLLANPQLLANYNLLKPAGANYAAKALSYLPQGNTLIWDEYQNKPSEEDSSVFRVLFKYPLLRWAYYIALFGLIVFVVFEVKRRQRIIPIINPLQNTTVEFVSLVGKLYYDKRNHKDLADKQINYYLAYIRNKYQLKTNPLDDEFTQSLFKKSAVPPENILELLHHINNLKNQQKISDKQLINLNKLIEQFYKLDH